MKKYQLIFLLTIIVFGCEKSVTITTQEEADIISNIVSELNFVSDANNQILTFTTNKDWKAVLSSLQDDISWCSISPSEGGAGTVDIVISVIENKEHEDRSATLSIKVGKVVKIVEISQMQNNAILLSKHDYEISSEGGVLEVEVDTNVDMEVSIPSEYDWIKVVEQKTRSLTNQLICLEVNSNETYDDRLATISITDKSNTIKQKITVRQESEKVLMRNINVVEAGTLRNLIGDDYLLIGELTVSGCLNGTDFNIIREMAGSNRVVKPTEGKLYKLDLSNSQIVEGGDAYIYPNNSNYTACYTSDNVIGDFMFSECKSLKQIILPNVITEIQDYSFYFCSNLQFVELSDSVEKIGESAFFANSELSDINLSDNITYIGKAAFAHCRSLEAVKIPQNLEFLSDQIFWYCENIKEIEIPKSVTYIGREAFSECRSLVTIDIPDLVHTIESRAFYNCPNITSLTIGSSMSNIGSEVFVSSSKIEEIYSKNPNPPAISYWIIILTFNEELNDKCKVYIPKGSYEAYYTSKGWRDFEYLIEIEF